MLTEKKKKHRGVEVVRLGRIGSHRHDLQGTQRKAANNHRGEHNRYQSLFHQLVNWFTLKVKERNAFAVLRLCALDVEEVTAMI